MNSWLTWLLLIAALCLAGLIGYSFVPQPVEVDLATVERGTVLVTVDEDGKTRIREKYVVSSPLSGRLLRIEHDPGDSVTASETLLATIEPRDPELLDARSIAQAKARVSAAQAALERTEPLLEQARIELDNSEIDLARARATAGLITADEIDDYEARYRMATEGIRSAKFAKAIALFELQQAESALLRSQPRDTELPSENGNGTWNHLIRSPITGRVLRVMQESTAVMTAGTPLLELGDPQDLEVVIDVLSSDAVKIQPGAKVMFEHWGGEDTLHGQVRLVEPSGFTKLSTLGVEEQRVNVIIDLTDEVEKRESLGDGFRVEARIVVAEATDVLRVPASSLFRPTTGWAVFLVKDGKARQVPVEVGHQNGLEAEIVSGLEPGDQVILHPSDKITEGVAIVQRQGRAVNPSQ